MKKVFIAEKPSVAMEFAKALKINSTRKNGYIESDEYIVTWCVGHLVTMSYPEIYDEKYRMWRYDTLPFIPTDWKYEVIENVKSQFEVVKTLLTREDVDTIYVCTDSGREGEYIYRLVERMANVQGKQRKRVWIDSQTEEEILRGIREAKDLSEYDALSDSAYLRAKEDYLIGINFSRLLTLMYGKKIASLNGEEKASVSIGRVMTCVLGMVVDRENEIRNFVKTKFYKIQAQLENDVVAEWKRNEQTIDAFAILKQVEESGKFYNENGFQREEDAQSFVEALKKKEARALVKEISKKKQKENAPLLYNLAELQNDCTRKFKISPDQTLEIVQELYEKKLVTYPRTDARVLSTAVAKEITKNLNGLAKWNREEKIKNILQEMIAKKYSTNLVKSKYVNDAKITDHYAIIPTGQGFENYDKVSELHQKIFLLIVKRFLSIFFPPAEYQKMALELEIAEQSFFANSKICTQKGYLTVIEEEKEETENKSSENLAKLKKGQELPIEDISIKEGETTPPNRYTSGSMILAMENAGKLIEDEKLREQIKGSGIGTSATRAEIIKKLNRIGYIETNAKTQILTPTNKGELIYKVVRYAMPDMLNPQLTASWEKGLDMVARKEILADEFMQKLESYIRARVSKVKMIRG